MDWSDGYSKLDDDSYKELLDLYGKDFADDVKAQTQGRFTYLVAEKKGKPDELSDAVIDSDLRLERRRPVTLDLDKIKSIIRAKPKMRIVPESVIVNGEVLFLEDLEDHPAAQHIDDGVDRKDPMHAPMRMLFELGNLSLSWYHSQRKRDVQKNKHQEIEALIQRISDWLIANKQDLTKDRQKRLKERIESLAQTNLVKQWFNHHPGSLQELIGILEDKAQISTPGGIDLNTDQMNLQTQNAGEAIKFHVDPAMLKRLQDAPGFVPVIINIQPMTDLRIFLGLS